MKEFTNHPSVYVHIYAYIVGSIAYMFYKSRCCGVNFPCKFVWISLAVLVVINFISFYIGNCIPFQIAGGLFVYTCARLVMGMKKEGQ
jgi:hypothetical protein